MQNMNTAQETDLGTVTPEQLAAYLAAEPDAHFVLRDCEGADWDPRSPAYWPDGLEGDSGNTIIDDWQNPMRLIRLEPRQPEKQIDESLWLDIFGDFNEPGRD